MFCVMASSVIYLQYSGYNTRITEESVVCCSYNLDFEEKSDGVNWSDHKTLPLSDQGTLCVTGPNQVRIIILFLPLYAVLATI